MIDLRRVALARFFVLLLCLASCRSDRYQKSDKMILVYNWFGPRPFPAFFVLNLNVSARRNDVIVLTDLPASDLPSPMSFGPTVSFVDMAPFKVASDSMDFFAGKATSSNAGVFYRPWGFKEPWEANNARRCFVMHEWAKSRPDVDNFFYADTDAVVLANLTEEFSGGETQWGTPECDAYLSFKKDPFDSLDWSTSAHLSMVNERLLGDFTQFVMQLYSPEFLPLLERKQKKRPFVTDMTHWYLFAASSGHIRDLPKDTKLPSVSQSWRLCDSQAVRHGAAFDGFHGHQRPGFELRSDGYASYVEKNPADMQKIRLMSLHFQGRTKLDVSTILAPMFGGKAWDGKKPLPHLVAKRRDSLDEGLDEPVTVTFHNDEPTADPVRILWLRPAPLKPYASTTTPREEAEVELKRLAAGKKFRSRAAPGDVFVTRSLQSDMLEQFVVTGSAPQYYALASVIRARNEL